jgi:hypothetical protein
MTQTHDHPHDHPHAHADPGQQAGEATPGVSRGAVVLDIGGDVGAAVVLTPASMDELELEIRRTGTEWDSTHVAVRQRVQPGRPRLHAAVYGSLPSGTYDLRVRFAAPGSVVHHVEVVGGQVTMTQWPESP